MFGLESNGVKFTAAHMKMGNSAYRTLEKSYTSHKCRLIFVVVKENVFTTYHQGSKYTGAKSNSFIHLYSFIFISISKQS